jgi:hypothetical protein
MHRIKHAFIRMNLIKRILKFKLAKDAQRCAQIMYREAVIDLVWEIWHDQKFDTSLAKLTYRGQAFKTTSWVHAHTATMAMRLGFKRGSVVLPADRLYELWALKTKKERQAFLDSLPA